MTKPNPNGKRNSYLTRQRNVLQRGGEADVDAIAAKDEEIKRRQSGQYEKGQSGNLAGRPRQPKNAAEVNRQPALRQPPPFSKEVGAVRPQPI